MILNVALLRPKLNYILRKRYYSRFWLAEVIHRIPSLHRDWRKEIGRVDQRNILEEVLTLYIKGSRSNTQEVFRTVHLNPNWLSEFKRDFKEVIVEKCSKTTREAIENNEDIKACTSPEL